MSAAWLHEDRGIRTGDTAAQYGAGTWVLVLDDMFSVCIGKKDVVNSQGLKRFNRVPSSHFYECCVHKASDTRFSRAVKDGRTLHYVECSGEI